MSVYEARLLCVHPLCRRWLDGVKTIRTQVWAETPEGSVEVAREYFRPRNRRRCPACRRPVALKNLTMWETDGNGNTTHRLCIGVNR